MGKLLTSINVFLYNDFIFSPRYRVWRHIAFWSFSPWPFFFKILYPASSFWHGMLINLTYLPAALLLSYPLAYFAIPYLLLKEKVIQFILALLAWGAAGLLFICAVRVYLAIPLQKGLEPGYNPGPIFQPMNYFILTTSAAGPVIIRFFKLWSIKQRDLLNARQEKITAELQLLKAQVHPHFLFNTLNNIYSFSLEGSSKTPELILRLSSLLSYMLYDCKAAEVRIEKELDIMKNYIELERERYGNNIDISWKVEGEIQDQFIAPLMMLPFIENAFKHGTSEQIEKCWLSVDILVQENRLKAKIANSKNEYAVYGNNGIGIANVKKRLEFIYPGHHELKLNDEGDFFVVTLMIHLTGHAAVAYPLTTSVTQPIKHETPLPAHR
ncbi:MAG: histidine kinase [Ferruginibacter sp.]